MALKFGILLTEDSAAWGDLAETWVAGLRGSADEEWAVYDTVHGNLPPLHEAATFTGFVITGSHYSVLDIDATPWMRAVGDFVVACNKIHPAVRFLGGCFGHQLISAVLGGKVSHNPSGVFVLGRESIQILPTSFPLRLPAVVNALQSHYDCVSAVPDGAVTLASSSTAAHEMVAIGSNIFTFQCHPEMTKDQLLTRILPRTIERRSLPQEATSAIQTDLASCVLDGGVLLSTASRFLHRGWAE